MKSKFCSLSGKNLAVYITFFSPYPEFVHIQFFTNSFIVFRVMSVDLKSFDRTHCFKRKLDQPEMVESCDHRRFWDQNQKLVLELTKNENDCSITCPEGKFLATYMKHTRSLHDVLGIMDDFINCDEYSYHPNMKIKRKFRSFVKSFKSQLYQFSCELIGDMKNGREDVVLLDNAEEPAIKLKK